jgi:hypothetical protein
MSSRHPHIAQRKQRHQLRRILDQPFVADLGETELALDHAKRVLDLRANAGFDLLGFVQQAARGHQTAKTSQRDRPDHLP